MNLRSWSVALLLSLPLSPLAQDLAEDEPVARGDAPEHGKAGTADASPVDRGTLEAEVAYAPTFNDGGGMSGFGRSSSGYAHGVAGTLTYGAYRDVDLKLSTGFARVYDAAHQHADGSTPKHGGGMTDTTLGARWRFLNVPERALELAATAEVVLPLGTDHTPTAIGVTQGFWSARGALVATKDLGALTTNAEVAVSAPVSGDAGGYRSTAQVNLAVGYQVHPALQPELELNYSHVSSLGPDAEVLAVTAGVVAPMSGGRRVVAGVQQAVLGRNATQTTSAIVAFKTSY